MQKSRKAIFIVLSILFFILLSSSAFAFGPDPAGYLNIPEQSNAKLMMIACGAFVIMLVAAEIVSRTAETVGAKLSPSIGIFVVAVTGSLPELAVSISAALAGNASLAIANIVGSNIANITLVLGLTTLIKPIKIVKGFLKSGMVFLVLLVGVGVMFLSVSSTSPFITSSATNTITAQEGVIMLASFAIYLVFLFIIRSKEQMEAGKGSALLNTVFVLLSGIIVWYSADTAVIAILEIAARYSISPLLLGATVVAIGTSLPELSISIMSVLKGKEEISFGNVIESNAFDMAVCLGIAALIIPLVVAPEIAFFHIPAMIVVNTVIMFLAADGEITKKEGLLLLAIYAVYIGFTIFMFGG